MTGDPQPSPSPAAALPRHLHFVLGLAAVCAARRAPPGAVWGGSPDAENWLVSLANLLEIDREALPSDVHPDDVTTAAKLEDWNGDVQGALARTLVQAALAEREQSGGGEARVSNEDKSGVVTDKDQSGAMSREKTSLETTPTSPPESPTSASGSSTPGAGKKFQATLNGWWSDLKDFGPGDKNKGDGKTDKNDSGASPQVTYTAVERAVAHATLERLGLDPGVLLPRAEAIMSASLVAALDDKSKGHVDEAREKQKHGWGGSWGRGLAIGAGVITSGVLLGVTGGLAAPAIAAVLAPLGIGALTAATAPIVIGTLFGLTGGGLAGWRVSERWRGVKEFGFLEVGAGTKPTKEEVEDLERRQAQADGETPEFESGELLWEAPEDDEQAAAEAAARKEVARSRRELDLRFGQLSLDASKGPKAPTPPPDATLAERAQAKPPSLTATIVVPGLLTVSRVEAVTAWRAVCCPTATPLYTTPDADGKPADVRTDGLRDGRDVYLLRYETDQMLKSGRDIETWVMSKLKTLAGVQVVKATVLSAYYIALSLPMSVYTFSTLALDNTWMVAQSRAVKAGRLLGDVLLQGVQGARPVVLVGTSLGALTVLTALQHLAENGATNLVESVFFISLPSAPTDAEWAAVRRATSRRVVNAWSGNDLVLAGVVRLHEVLSRGVTGKNGTCVAGLGPVKQPGIEDVDLSEILKGHGEINAKLDDILGVLEMDD